MHANLLLLLVFAPTSTTLHLAGAELLLLLLILHFDFIIFQLFVLLGVLGKLGHVFHKSSHEPLSSPDGLIRGIVFALTPLLLHKDKRYDIIIIIIIIIIVHLRFQRRFSNTCAFTSPLS